MTTTSIRMAQAFTLETLNLTCEGTTAHIRHITGADPRIDIITDDGNLIMALSHTDLGNLITALTHVQRAGVIGQEES